MKLPALQSLRELEATPYPLKEQVHNTTLYLFLVVHDIANKVVGQDEVDSTRAKFLNFSSVGRLEMTIFRDKYVTP
jgi:hypothetical protein